MEAACAVAIMVDFAALRDMGQSKSTVRTLNFGKAKFQLFKELVGSTLC